MISINSSLFPQQNNKNIQNSQKKLYFEQEGDFSEKQHPHKALRNPTPSNNVNLSAPNPWMWSEFEGGMQWEHFRMGVFALSSLKSHHLQCSSVLT